MELIAIFSQFTIIEQFIPLALMLTVTRTSVPPEIVRPANLYVESPSGSCLEPIQVTAAASFTLEQILSSVAELEGIFSSPELSFKPRSLPAIIETAVGIIPLNQRDFRVAVTRGPTELAKKFLANSRTTVHHFQLLLVDCRPMG